MTRSKTDKEAIRGILQLGYRCMDGAGAGIILRAGRLTVQRMFELRTVRNASYYILGLNCSSEDSAQYRKLDSLVKPYELRDRRGAVSDAKI